MEHVYTIPSVTIVEEKSDFNKVAVSATVYLTTKETFDHTFERPEYDMEAPMGEPTMVTVTEEKTVEHFQHFTVDFDTSSLDPLMFAEWDALTEEQVIEWVKSTKDVTPLEEKGAAIVAEKKDRILNPKKYQYDTPVTPWRARADQEAAEQL
jgi:hypothetical protein